MPELRLPNSEPIKPAGRASSAVASSVPMESALMVAGVVVGVVVGKFVLPKVKAAYEPVVDVSAHNANVRA